MDTQLSKTPRPYFRPTTVSQRELLFRVAAETGNVSAAARQAHVGRGTYYYWRERQTADPVEGLRNERSRAPKRTHLPPISEALKAEVLDYHQAHPTEGYRTVANRICQAHNWERVISHSKVGEIIREIKAATKLLTPPPVPSPTFLPPVVVHSSQPGETINIDLCVVPLTHRGEIPLAAMSVYTAATIGVEPEEAPAKSSPAANPAYPGQAFANNDQSYAEQMQTYVVERTAKRASKGERKHRRRVKQTERAELNAQTLELRLHRRRQKKIRKAEDEAYRAKREAQRVAKAAEQKRSRHERRERRAEQEAARQQAATDLQTRRSQLQQRQVEDEAWRKTRADIRAKEAWLKGVVPITAWIAILVVIDNCTRLTYGLPLFTAGPHVTAEMVVESLRACCPPQLAFLISDNGPQFIAEAFARFMKDMEATHVRIAPHRPCTNGIAERSVRTLKEWLGNHSWNSPEELTTLLSQFKIFYNDRPHQGAELNGLSPNEFDRRCRCSTC